MGGLDESGSPPSKRMKLLAQVSYEAPCNKGKALEGYPSIASSGSYSISSALLELPMALMTSVPGTPEPLLGPNGLIRKVEFVRLITQSLYSLGYKNAAALLQEESGVALESDAFSDFQQLVLQRRWDDSIAALKKLEILDAHAFNCAASLILQKKFTEFLRNGNLLEAIKTLHSEITPLITEKERLHDLAACLVCPSRLELVIGSNRLNGTTELALLLEQLQGIISPAVMMPKKRLENLVEQALNIQVKACVHHNIPQQPLSLFHDHECEPYELPTRTLQVLEGHEDEIWFLQFSHNGKFLASASKDKTAKIWEVVNEEAKLKYTLTGHKEPVCMAAWSPDDHLLLTCGIEKHVKLWDVEYGECKYTLNMPDCSFTSCAWFPDGKRFISCGLEKCFYIMDITGKELDCWDMSRDKQIRNLLVTPNGLHIISSCHKEIMFVNVDSKLEHTIHEEEPVTSLSLGRDGRFLLVNLLSHEIHLWDISGEPKLVSRYKGHRQTRFVIRSCFGGSNEAFIASGSEDSQVYIWHKVKGELLEVLPGHSGSVNCVSWNPINPYLLASASDDHTIRIWSREGCSTGRQRHAKS